MNLRYPTIALMMAISIAVARSQSPPPPAELNLPAAELIHEVVANELADRAQQRQWMYLIDKRDGNRTLSQEQVDTQNGPLYRLRAIDGTPLDPGQKQQDNVRLDRFMHDPGQQLKLKKEHDQDEEKLEQLMKLMPGAFLYDYDGVEGPFIRLKFRPDPNFAPPTYEARVAHSLAGTLLIDPQQKRLAKFSGQLTNRVEFGFGILGHLDQGGIIEIGRVEVAPSQWKTALVNIQLSGRLIFFKTISKQEYETRSAFRAVPGDLSLLQASQLLAQ